MKRTPNKNLSCKNKIQMFLHCGLCLSEKPNGVSPKDYARLAVGWTKDGLQVWCNRHNVNVMHVDFEGVKHPANLNMVKKAA